MIIEQPKIKHTPSRYQSDIYNAVLHTDKNIVIKASAGSGKTSTIIEASKLISPSKCSLFAAFNKSIVEELSSRLPTTVTCATLHSLGMSAMMAHFRTSFKVSEYKSFQFIEAVLKNKPEAMRRDAKQIMAYKFALKDAVDMCRMTMTELKEEDIFNMCMYYNIDLLENEIFDVIGVIESMEIYNRSFSKKYNYIDYVDMIYVPVTNWKIKMPQFDFVFVDELQDLNKSQHLLLDRLVAPGGRTVGVGDPNQSLYSFAGADINSFNRFESRRNTITLPLSISYRCGTEIVELARQIYDDIEPCVTNEAGEIRYGTIDEIDEGDMVVCRNNRPLMILYFDLLEKGKNPIIIGKDIQVGLEALISKCLKKTTEEGVEIIYERLMKLVEELKAKGVKNVKEHPRYIDLHDKIRTIEIIAQRFEYMKQVKEEIGRMFEVKEKCIKLLTIHRSKGLEADRVFYIERCEGKVLLPSPYAIQDWQMIQERNLSFVAITRAKKAYIIIQNIN